MLILKGFLALIAAAVIALTGLVMREPPARTPSTTPWLTERYDEFEDRSRLTLCANLPHHKHGQDWWIAIDLTAHWSGRFWGTARERGVWFSANEHALGKRMPFDQHPLRLLIDGDRDGISAALGESVPLGLLRRIANANSVRAAYLSTEYLVSKEVQESIREFLRRLDAELEDPPSVTPAATVPVTHSPVQLSSHHAVSRVYDAATDETRTSISIDIPNLSPGKPSLRVSASAAWNGRGDPSFYRPTVNVVLYVRGRAVTNATVGLLADGKRSAKAATELYGGFVETLSDSKAAMIRLGGSDYPIRDGDREVFLAFLKECGIR